MKVLITAPSLDEKINVSGISTVARQIIERGANDYVHFEAGRRDGEQAGISWIFRQISSVPRFWRTLQSEKIDLVHLNTTLNFQAIARDLTLATIARFVRVPILLHLHGGRFLAEEFQNKRLARLAETMLRKAETILVLSDLERRIIEKRWRGLNVRVLENAVPVDETANLSRKNELPVLIFLGRLHESKGLNEIAEACRELKNAGFDFRFEAYGAGEMKDSFVSEMKEILGDEFYFGGVVSGAQKMRALSEADVFLLPSRYGEGLPMALLEAMGAGCVPIVSEMASIGAVVKTGENGFLIEPGNTQELIEKLKFLLENQNDWENLRGAAQRTIREKFALNSYIKRLESIYAEIKK